MTERDDRRARLRNVYHYVPGNPFYVGLESDIEDELEASERDRKSLALARGLIARHLMVNGPCEDAPEDYADDYEPCDDENCSYCAMCVSEFGKAPV